MQLPPPPPMCFVLIVKACQSMSKHEHERQERVTDRQHVPAAQDLPTVDMTCLRGWTVVSWIVCLGELILLPLVVPLGRGDNGVHEVRSLLRWHVSSGAGFETLSKHNDRYRYRADPALSFHQQHGRHESQ